MATQIKNSLKEDAKVGKCHLLEFDLEVADLVLKLVTK